MQLKRRSVTISFDLPREVDDEDLADFIVDALGTMGGCRHPDDPLFDSLDVKKVRIGRKVFIAPG